MRHELRNDTDGQRIKSLLLSTGIRIEGHSTACEEEFWEEIQRLQSQLTIAREALEVVAMIEELRNENTILRFGQNGALFSRPNESWSVIAGRHEKHLGTFKTLHAALSAAVEQRRAGK